MIEESLKETIADLLKRIEKLEARPLLYQRNDSLGNPTGLVYSQGQTKLHEPVELDYIRDKNSSMERG